MSSMTVRSTCRVATVPSANREWDGHDVRNCMPCLECVLPRPTCLSARVPVPESFNPHSALEFRNEVQLVSMALSMCPELHFPQARACEHLERALRTRPRGWSSSRPPPKIYPIMDIMGRQCRGLDFGNADRVQGSISDIRSCGSAVELGEWVGGVGWVAWGGVVSGVALATFGSRWRLTRGISRGQLA